MRPVLPVLTALLSAATPALAQDRDNARYSADATSHWSFEFGAGTDNRSKGTSKTDDAPYVFGEVQWNAASGFYADAEFETINSSGSRVETELEAGWQFSAVGLDFDTSLSRKWRLDADPGQDDDAWEYQFDILRDFGPVDTRLRLEHSPDGLGSTRATTWVEARLRWPLADRLRASATLGRREQDNAPDYTGWNAGVAWSVTDTTALDLRWHGTDAKDLGSQYEDALVASILLAF
ncbi:TorF family putative porin [Brevundimonas sp. R86498]|uniref:TorF family putative porin n=1 Tax=Brevundimonas sp. R86498 TaxID=3093845 RepID=UPI0037CC38B9